MPKQNSNLYRDRGDGVTEIVTTKGDIFLIDTVDVEIAKRHCWIKHFHGYARSSGRKSSGKQVTFYLHRILCPTTEDRPHVDHINGDRSDCRKRNLRACSRQENLRNQKRRTDNTTGFKGVGLHKPSGMYRARVRAADKVLQHGLFKTPEEAAAAAAIRRDALHREFARHD